MTLVPGTVGLNQAKTLDPRVAEFQMALDSRLLKSGIDTSVLLQDLDSFVLFEFKKTVYSDKLAEETLEFEESPVYKSHRLAFLAGLPENSWRRRFFAHWWGIDPMAPLATKKVHEVKVERWACLPDAGLYPEGAGPVYYQQNTTPMEYWA